MLFLFVYFSFFPLRKIKISFCNYQETQRGRTGTSHTSGETERSQIISLMLDPSLRTAFKWNRGPFFTVGCYGLLVTILLYAVLELGTRNKLNCFTLCVTKFMKNH